MTVVLVVEDNPVNRDVVGRRLTRRGFSVRFAEDGPAGVLAAAIQRPDVILMDITLGDMDGYEATRLIWADPRNAEVPIIALTANVFETDRQKAYVVWHLTARNLLIRFQWFSRAGNLIIGT